MRHYSVATRLQTGCKMEFLEFLPYPEFEIEIVKNSKEISNDDFNILGKSYIF